MISVAHINIGSNLGCSRSLIEQAVAGISLISLTEPHISSFIESEPWGFESKNNFLNVGMEITTDIHPQLLLAKLLEIQNSISSQSHRTESGEYTDRLIDIDLIYYGDSIITLPETDVLPAITLPHPKMHLRLFVLQPIAQLAPHWIHPLLNLSAAELMQRL